MSEVQVRCTVDNCYFWDNDNFCGAQSILITSHGAAPGSPGADSAQSTASMASQIGSTPVNQSVDTACKTFQPQD